MNVFIPKIGTRLVLSKPWTFKLQDTYKNKKFWVSFHGTPTPQIYYAGYMGGNGSYTTSDTPFIGGQPCNKTLPPIDTTIPKGTVMYVDSFHIQKGHEPCLSLRIMKDDFPKAYGKFMALISEVNKMEIESECLEKYPNGRFSLHIKIGVDRNMCTCKRYPCLCHPPQYTDKFLCWESECNSSRSNLKTTAIKHRTNTAGLDEIKVEHIGGRSNKKNYTKYFDNIEDLLNLARKKCCSDAHINEFIKNYDEQRIAWETSKA